MVGQRLCLDPLITAEEKHLCGAEEGRVVPGGAEVGDGAVMGAERSFPRTRLFINGEMNRRRAPLACLRSIIEFVSKPFSSMMKAIANNSLYSLIIPVLLLHLSITTPVTR